MSRRPHVMGRASASGAAFVARHSGAKADALALMADEERVALEPAGSPEEYRQREEDDVQETAVRDGRRFDAGPEDFRGSDDPTVPCDIREPVRADLAEKEAERLENEGDPLGGLAGHDHGSLTACDPACPGFRAPSSQASPLSPQGADHEPQAPTAAELSANVADAIVSLASAKETAEHAAVVVVAIEGCLARAIDRKARDMGARGHTLCTIGGITYRPKAPRKKRGQPEDTGALWGLERVEVGE